MKKSLRTALLGLGIAAISGLSLAADTAGGATEPSAPVASPATNVQTPTTKPAKKKVRHSKKSHQGKPAAKKSGS